MVGHIKSLKIGGVSKGDTVSKFKEILLKKFEKCEEKDTKGRIIFCCKIPDKESSEEITVTLYPTDKIVLQGSPKISRKTFEKVSSEIQKIAEKSLTKKEKTPQTIRVEKFMKFVDGLDNDNEIQRLIIPIMCSTCIEMIIDDKLSKYVRLSEIEKIPTLKQKIESLENKIKGTIKQKEEIYKIRVLRNKVVHGGDLITTEEAKWTKKTTKEIIKNLLML